MKTKKLFFLMIITSLVSCKTDNLTDRSLEIMPRDNIKQLLEDFIQENGNTAPIYELYIDKVWPWEFDIVIYAGDISLSDSISSIMHTYVSGVKFYIYTGVEHYFGNLGNPVIQDGLRQEGMPPGRYWTVIDDNGNLNIEKDDSAHPFYSLPNKSPFLSIPEED